MPRQVNPDDGQETRRNELSRLVALLYAVIITLFSLILLFAAFRNQSPLLGMLGGAAFLSAGVLLPRLEAWLGILLFGFLCLCFGFASPFALRLCLLAFLLTIVSSSRIPLPPVVTALVFWIVWWYVAPLCISESNSTAELGALLVELPFLVLCGILGANPRVQFFFRGGTAPLPFFFHALHMVLAALVSTLICFAVLAPQILPSRMEVLELLQRQPITLFLAFGMLPALFAALLDRRIVQMSKQIIALAEQGVQAIVYEFEPSGIAIVDRALRAFADFAAQASTELRKTVGEVKNLRRQADEMEKSVRDRELTAENLLTLVDSSPWGTLACTGSGMVIAANSTFAEILALDRRAIVGKPLTVVDEANPWQREVTQLINWACRDYSTLVKKGVVRHYLSPWENYFLEVELQARLSSEIAESGGRGIRPADAALLVFVRRVPDTREFQLQLLQPRGFELIGVHLDELTRHFENELNSLVTHLSVVSRLVQMLAESTGKSLADTPIGVELLVNLRELDKIVRRGLQELRRVREQNSEASAQRVSLDLAMPTKHLFDFLYELLGVEDRVTVQVHKGAQNESSPPEDDTVSVSIAAEDVAPFFSYFLNLARTLLPVAPTLEVSIDYELIDLDGAELFVGSLPGYYARISLFHAGQSLTANMLSGRFLENVYVRRDLADRENALILLQRQLSKMRGFMSVQSTAAKGTTISLYLPVSLNQSTEMFKQTYKSRRMLRHDEIDVCETSGNRKALVLAFEDATILAAKTVLTHLGYELEVRHIEALLGELEKPLDCEGRGFADQGEEPLLGQNEGEGVKGTFGVVLLELGPQPARVISLLHHLEVEHAQSALVVLIDPDAEQHVVLADWATVAKPLDVETLEAAIKRARELV